MDIKLQLITFIFSFVYGFIYFYLVKLNRLLTKNNKTIVRYIDTSLFTLDSVLIYVVINYKINEGYFHIYFIIILTIGFFIAYYTEKSVNQLKKKLIKEK